MDKRKKLTEDQVLEKFRESMEHEPVPEELTPKKVEDMLKQYVNAKETGKKESNRKEDNGKEDNSKEDYGKEDNGKENGKAHTMEMPAGKNVHKNHFFSRYAAAAAAVVFVAVVGLSAWQIQRQNGISGSGTEVSMADNAQQGNMEEAESGEKAESGEEADIRILGDHVYEQAADYGSVYDVLKKTEERYQQNEKQGWFSQSIKADSSESGEATAGARDGVVYLAENDAATEEIATEEYAEAAAEAATEDNAATYVQEDASGKSSEGFSATNVQTEGVDESDIIKTDGDYIYQANGNQVNIYDIRKEELKLVHTIDMTKESAADSIREIYLQNEVLSVIMERKNTEMKQEQSEDVFSVDTKIVTTVETYNIHDRTAPEKIGEYEQDGNYYTSRKKGDIIYLFTGNGMALPIMERNRAVMEDTADIWLPCINGEAVAAYDIYLPEYGSQSMLIGSFNCTNPQKKIDSKMVLNDYAQIYVSQNAIYFYRTDYSNAESTEIAKFSMNNGKLKAVAAESVKGAIQDTFAINESDGYLRVLTTLQNGGQQSNQVYVLDDKLQLAGQIENLAPDEQIYAARFMGNTGYLVTYRNTDPLFSVDFTDPKNPVILGELEITGFSEYLHFWGKDKLLGIGYETDPVTGEQMGIKLSMFDISDPSNVEECAKTVLKNIDYTPALYEYKTVLVDQEENLIGFTAECYGNEDDGWTYRVKYLLFAYQDGEFTSLMAEDLGDVSNPSAIRGLFAQGRFFLADPYRVAAYERENYTLQKEVETTNK